eukprot:m.17695 g.17695  ORF g.17695 m.17695 type:complete len:1149 (+) comp3268_c0_seq2:2-3448(+)
MADVRAWSQETLRERLYDALRTHGVVDSIKSQVRNRMLLELRRQAPPARPDREGSPMFQRAVDSLIVDHLRTLGYEGTLSVFLPESSNDLSSILPIEDIDEVFRLDPTWRLRQSTAPEWNRWKSHLCRLLHYVLDHFSRSTLEVSAQTDPDTAFVSAQLDARLLDVEREYARKGEVDKRDTIRAAEDRMLAFQRECEDRARAQVEDEINRFRASEAARIRAEETLKHQQQMDDARLAMERSFSLREDAARKREADGLARLRQREAELETDNHELRQRLMKHLEREAWSSAETKAHFKDLLDKQLEEQRLSVRFELEKDYEMQRLQIQQRETAAREQLALASHHQAVHRDLTAQLEQMRQHAEHLQASLTAKHEELGAKAAELRAMQDRLHAMSDYDMVVRQAGVLQEEVRATSERLSRSCAQKDSELALLRQTLQDREARLAELVRPSAELSALHEAKHRSELDLQRSAILLDVERQRSQDLLVQLESERSRSAGLQREVAELRQLLQRAHTMVGQEPRMSSTRLGASFARPPQTPMPTMPPPTMNTTMRQHYPVVDNVRRRLADLGRQEADGVALVMPRTPVAVHWAPTPVSPDGASPPAPGAGQQAGTSRPAAPAAPSSAATSAPQPGARAADSLSHVRDLPSGRYEDNLHPPQPTASVVAARQPAAAITGASMLASVAAVNPVPPAATTASAARPVPAPQATAGTASANPVSMIAASASANPVSSIAAASAPARPAPALMANPAVGAGASAPASTPVLPAPVASQPVSIFAPAPSAPAPVPVAQIAASPPRGNPALAAIAPTSMASSTATQLTPNLAATPPPPSKVFVPPSAPAPAAAAPASLFAPAPTPAPATAAPASLFAPAPTPAASIFAPAPSIFAPAMATPRSPPTPIAPSSPGSNTHSQEGPSQGAATRANIQFRATDVVSGSPHWTGPDRTLSPDPAPAPQPRTPLAARGPAVVTSTPAALRSRTVFESPESTPKRPGAGRSRTPTPPGADLHTPSAASPASDSSTSSHQLPPIAAPPLSARLSVPQTPAQASMSALDAAGENPDMRRALEAVQRRREQERAAAAAAATPPDRSASSSAKDSPADVISEAISVASSGRSASHRSDRSLSRRSAFSDRNYSNDYSGGTTHGDDDDVAAW